MSNPKVSSLSPLTPRAGSWRKAVQARDAGNSWAVIGAPARQPATIRKQLTALRSGRGPYFAGISLMVLTAHTAPASLRVSAPFSNPSGPGTTMKVCTPTIGETSR